MHENVHRDFFVFLSFHSPCFLHGILPREVFRYEFTEGVPTANDAWLGCVGKRTAAFRDLCQIGYSVCFSPATFAPAALAPSVPLYRKIFPEQEAARLQTKGKRLNFNAYQIF